MDTMDVARLSCALDSLKLLKIIKRRISKKVEEKSQEFLGIKKSYELACGSVSRAERAILLALEEDGIMQSTKDYVLGVMKEEVSLAELEIIDDIRKLFSEIKSMR